MSSPRCLAFPHHASGRHATTKMRVFGTLQKCRPPLEEEERGEAWTLPASRRLPQRPSFLREASSQLMYPTCVNAIAFSRIYYHLFYRAHARWPDPILSCRRNIAIWLGAARRPAADNKAEFRRIHSAGYERARVYLADRFSRRLYPWQL